MKLSFLISGLVLLVFVNSWSQSSVVKHFGVEDGLASNRVYSAFQDSRGFIWLTTTNGVSRFDGKEFKNFTSNQGLPDNDIFGIAEDLLGRLWLSCYNGEPCYIYKDKIFTVANDSLLKQIPLAGYHRFNYIHKRMVLVKSNSGPCFEIDHTGKLTSIPFRGVFLCGFKNNLLHVVSSRTKDIFKYYLLDSNYREVDSLVLNCFGAERISVKETYPSGETSFVILLSDSSCLRYKIDDNKIVFVNSIAKTSGLSGIYPSGSKLWISSVNKGIIPVDSQLMRDPTRSTLFENLSIEHFLIDREGNYWGCTSGKGLYMIPNTHFSYYNVDKSPDQNDILKLTSRNNDVYLGCANAIYNYRKLHDQSLRPFATFQDKLVDLYMDDQNVVAATSKAIYSISKENTQVKKFSIEHIKCLAKGPGNSILFGTHGSGFQLNFPDSIITVSRGRTLALYTRKNGDVLVGTLNGLFVARKNTSGIWQTDTVRVPVILKKTRITCIKEIDGILAVGTVQKGLILIDGTDYEFVNLGAGLKDINCKDLFVDASKNLWLASFAGVFKITLNASIHSYKVQNIRKFNGLLSDDVNDIAVVNDTVYVAGTNGLTTFFSKKTPDTFSPPTVFITDVRIQGIPYPASHGEINLPFDSNSVNLHFSAIDFKSLGNILFKYRLTDVQKNWYYSTDNFARFEALGPGDYQFEVWAMNAQNVWSAAPALLRIHVSPAWWQSAWFYCVLIILVIAFIYFMVRLRFQKKHRLQMRESSLRRHVAELELRAIKAQMNPHFIFNTLNTIQYFINNHDDEKAENYLNRLADLLRKTMDFSEKTTVPVHAEINYLENYLELEKLRFDENFVFTITSNLSPRQGNTEIPPMVLQPHVENALRHGFKNRHNTLKKLDITFNMVNDQLVCEVTDNGIGRKASAGENEGHQRSRGMELSHSKLLLYESITGKKIKTDIQDNYAEDDKTATGTLIRISITQ